MVQKQIYLTMDKSLFNNKGLNIMHLNIRSLFCKNKFEMFKNQMCNSGSQIICLSETWLKSSMRSSYIDIENYNVSRLDRNWSEGGHLKKGGGVCMY